MVLLIGITGGICSGKTTVVNSFKNISTVIINADQIVHQILKEKSIQKSIVNLLGSTILTHKKLDRRKIGAIVFSNSETLTSYNKLFHPYLLKELKSMIKKLKKDKSTRYIILDAALIIEWKLQELFDIVIIVDSFITHRLKRIKKLFGLSKKEALNRINSQIPIHKKRMYADYIINNNGSLADLQKKSKKLFQEIQKKY